MTTTMPAQLTPGARCFRAVSLDRERMQTRSEGEDRIPVCISSEAPYDRWDYLEILGHTAEEINTTYSSQGLPFCLDHDTRKVAGRVEDITLDADGRLRGWVRFGAHPDAPWVKADMESGVRPHISIGYSVEAWELMGKQENGYPIYRMTRWTPLEVSSVAVPADPTVGTNRSADLDAPPGQDHTRGPITPRTRGGNDMSGPKTGEPPVAGANEAELARARAEAQQAERQRVSDIRTLGRDNEIDQATVDAAIDEGLTPAEAGLRFLAAKKRAAGAAPAISGVRDRGEDKPWENDGEFYRAVIAAGRNPHNTDVRLLASRAQNTGVGEEGGFAVPVQPSTVLLEAIMTGGEILSRVSERPVTVGNTFSETVVKEEARTDGSRNGGVRHYWLNEDGSYIESQAATRQVEGKLQKLGALVKLTDEQLEDGPALASFLNEQVPEELRFGAERSIWEGSGAGQCLGAMNGGGLITVPIEASQTIANTAGNLWVNAAKMYSRMPARLLQDAGWFINQELWAKILTATAGVSGGSHPMFTPPGRLEMFPNGAIYGRPIVPVEYASAEGTVGDFTFIAWKDYLFAKKGDIRQSSSMHVDFVRDKQALKFTWRVNGQPRTAKPVTPLKGGNTISPYIALAARS